MTRECVNNGGPGSIVRLTTFPTLETPLPLSGPALAALAAWRARPGAILTVVDPEQVCYRARLVAEGGVWQLVPFQRLGRSAESSVAVEVCQALPDKERFELVLQKLTELGITRIVPMTTRRSATLAERDSGQKKSHRWPDVVLRAARQCRRAMLPELAGVTPWTAAIADCRADLKLMLYEGEGGWGFDEALAGQRPGRVALLIGPEGGFDAEEVDQARAAGFLPVSLGPRILRTETAAIVAAALVQYAVGDLR